MARTRKPGAKTARLQIPELSVKTLDTIGEMASAMRPPVSRNDLITYWLDEIAAGRAKVQFLTAEIGDGKEAA